MIDPRPRRLMRVQSFGPQILQLLTLGAKNTVEFRLPWRKAIRLRQRIYQLRAAMQREEHSLYPLVSKVQLDITEYPDARRPPTQGRDHPVRCTLGPGDHEYDDLLTQLGLEPVGSEPEPNVALPPEPDDPTFGTDIDSILGELK